MLLFSSMKILIRARWYQAIKALTHHSWRWCKYTRFRRKNLPSCGRFRYCFNDDTTARPMLQRNHWRSLFMIMSMLQNCLLLCMICFAWQPNSQWKKFITYSFYEWQKPTSPEGLLTHLHWILIIAVSRNSKISSFCYIPNTSIDGSRYSDNNLMAHFGDWNLFAPREHDLNKSRHAVAKPQQQNYFIDST